MLLWLDRRHAKQNRNWNENYKELPFTTGTIVLYHNYSPWRWAARTRHIDHWAYSVVWLVLHGSVPTMRTSLPSTTWRTSGRIVPVSRQEYSPGLRGVKVWLLWRPLCPMWQVSIFIGHAARVCQYHPCHTSFNAEYALIAMRTGGRWIPRANGQ